jgi:hypothetical protein
MNVDKDRGPQLAEWHVHPRQHDKAKRILRQILSEAPALRDDAIHHVPMFEDKACPLGWLLGFDPEENLVLTIRLRTRQVELLEG